MHRGKLVTFSVHFLHTHSLSLSEQTVPQETSINIGILLGFILGFALSGLALSVGWRIMLALGAVISFIQLLRS